MKIYITINSQLVAHKLQENLKELLQDYQIEFKIINDYDVNESLNINNILFIEDNILNDNFDFFKNNFKNIIIITDNLYISDDSKFNEMTISYKPLLLNHLQEQILTIIQKNKNTITINDCTLTIEVNKAFLYQKNTNNTCQLSPIEAKIMYLLFFNYPKCVSKEFLLQEVWEINSDIETKTLESHIHNTRNKLTEHNIKLNIDKRKEGFILSFLSK